MGTPAFETLTIRYICTFAVANVLYLAKESFERQGYISVNNLTRSFWFDLLGGNLSGEEEIWTMTRDGDQRKGMFETSLRALLDTADHFMGVGRAHAPDGRMSEQMDRSVMDVQICSSSADEQT